MLAVGTLLLTASGGYYAYAQFAKAGREDFIHEVPRPTFPDRSSSAFAGTETRPSFGQSQAIEVTPVDLESKPSCVRGNVECIQGSHPHRGGGLPTHSRRHREAAFAQTARNGPNTHRGGTCRPSPRRGRIGCLVSQCRADEFDHRARGRASRRGYRGIALPAGPPPRICGERRAGSPSCS